MNFRGSLSNRIRTIGLASSCPLSSSLFVGGQVDGVEFTSIVFTVVEVQISVQFEKGICDVLSHANNRIVFLPIARGSA